MKKSLVISLLFSAFLLLPGYAMAKGSDKAKSKPNISVLHETGNSFGYNSHGNFNHSGSYNFGYGNHGNYNHSGSYNYGHNDYWSFNYGGSYNYGNYWNFNWNFNYGGGYNHGYNNHGDHSNNNHHHGNHNGGHHGNWDGGWNDNDYHCGGTDKPNVGAPLDGGIATLLLGSAGAAYLNRRRKKKNQIQ